MKVMQGHTIIKEGEPGKEMYMILTGEVEVSEQRYRGLDAAPVPLGFGIRDQGPEKQQAGAFEDVRLGFLSEGAFFGEAPVLGRVSFLWGVVLSDSFRSGPRSRACVRSSNGVFDMILSVADGIWDRVAHANCACCDRLRVVLPYPR